MNPNDDETTNGTIKLMNEYESEFFGHGYKFGLPA